MHPKYSILPKSSQLVFQYYVHVGLKLFELGIGRQTQTVEAGVSDWIWILLPVSYLLNLERTDLVSVAFQVLKPSDGDTVRAGRVVKKISETLFGKLLNNLPEPQNDGVRRQIAFVNSIFLPVRDIDDSGSIEHHLELQGFEYLEIVNRNGLINVVSEHFDIGFAASHAGPLYAE